MIRWFEAFERRRDKSLPSIGNAWQLAPTGASASAACASMDRVDQAASAWPPPPPPSSASDGGMSMLDRLVANAPVLLREVADDVEQEMQLNQIASTIATAERIEGVPVPEEF